MNKHSLKKLPQELINQIAAGEVVERPSSVVKELLDNSIDAGADQIRIKIDEGGIKLIEISDNGVGIAENELQKVFEPHTTSKIASMEDLNGILTMGFRGEALSTILSVAKVSISSKFEQSDLAYTLAFKDSKPETTKKAARNQGTTITVEDLFYNVPARRKFLKTPETEYRKILETLIPYFLQCPNIHFILEKNGKEIYNLPKTNNEPRINEDRVQSVLKGEFPKNLIPVSAEGEGMKISGYIGHPSLHQSKGSNQYILINRRPVWDNGITKSVYLGYGTYIPRGEKVPFIISIEIRPDLIDVNVHPRKEEIKFINPFRAYSLVENAVVKALSKGITLSDKPSAQEFPTYTSTPKQQSAGQQMFDTPSSSYQSKPKEINFSKRGQEFDIKQSLEFSKEALKDISEKGDVKNVFQVFNKYIILEFEDELWMIDQHAAAERITFERLERSYNSKEPDIQQLLVPTEIEASEIEISFVSENKEFFSKLGFDIETNKDGIIVKSTPAYFQQADIEKVFRELWELSDEERDMKDSFDKAKDHILATMSCHSSIRTGQPLSREECFQVYKDLKQCKNPYSCPHGRPIVWKQKLSDLDTHFDRTY